MSSENGTQSDIHISDEDGVVDRKTKEHILGLRRQIDMDERELFIQDLKDPNINLSYGEATQFWSITIKQYIRSIKRIYDSDNPDISDVPRVGFFFEEKKIGEITLMPPDKDGIPFGRLAQSQGNPQIIKQRFGLPKDEDLPQPVTKEWYGLNSILNRDVVEHRWTVYTSKTGAPPNWEQLTLETRQPVPKGILEQAVETADNFLQQAGIGFEIEAEPYMAEGEPGL